MRTGVDRRFKLAVDGQKLKALEIAVMCDMSSIRLYRYSGRNSNWLSRIRALVSRQQMTGKRDAPGKRELLLISKTIRRQLTLRRLLTTTERGTLPRSLVMPYAHTLAQEVASHALKNTWVA